MRLLNWAVAALAALAFPVAGQGPAQIQPVTQGPAASVQAPVVSKPGTAQPHDLGQADVDAWLDGFMPYALKSGGIPGAVVVVVKDGQPLTMRGFGYADVKARTPVDPSATLFRPGSVSKLLTWTAVMQQVQAGKIDLDEDINTYLDFKIPEKFGEPITMRNLMTHTAGFAETAKYLINHDDIPPQALGEALSRWVPERIYAPGAMPAYSNYGASLAGYIVERVTGEPFNQYVQQHILRPTAMRHSTFEQPLPAEFVPFMSKAYEFGSDKPQPYEVIPLAPAGSLAATGADMGRFMIAHLANGGPLLNPASARLLHAPANKPYSALPGMGLGFYHEGRNGLNIVGHGGDTVYFHSDLHLFLDKNVGLFISMNSAGKAGAAQSLRGQLFKEFTDRYFPAPQPHLPTLGTAKQHGEVLAGHYITSRAGGFNFLRLVSLLGQTSVAVDEDNHLVVSSITDAAGTPREWREIGPWLWQEVDGTDKLQAIINDDGSVKMFSITPFAPIIEFLPAPASFNAGWILPVAGIALVIILIAALGWPIVALVRRRYKYPSPLKDRPLFLHRATRGTAWLLVILTVGWLAVIAAINSDLTALNGGLDIWMRLLQLLLILAIVGTVLAIWNAWSVARAPGRHWVAAIWAVLIALAAAFLVWLSLNVGLLTASLNY